MLFCLPATHVDAHLGNYGLGVLYFDAIDSCKVHARDAVQLPAEIKTRLIRLNRQPPRRSVHLEKHYGIKC